MPVIAEKPSTTRQEYLPGQGIDFIGSEEFEELHYSRSELNLVRELTSVVSTSGRTNGDMLLGSLLNKSLEPLSADEERILFRRMNYTKFQAEAIQSTLSATRPSQKKLVKIDSLLEEADHIKCRIAESNLRLVASIARKYARSSQDFQEFVSDGLLILLGAIQKFDYSRGFRFSTYATHSVQRHYFRAGQRMQKYSQRFPSTAAEVLANVSGVDNEPNTRQDAAIVYRQLMESAQSQLTEREESILNRRFGTGGFGMTQTLHEVASDLGISKERVRQIQIAALEKLRAVAADSNLIPTAV